MPRAKTRIYRLLDCEPDIAVVRCPDGNLDEFWALVAQHVLEEEALVGREPEGEPDPATWPDAKWLAFVREHIAPPAWRWYRHNPDSSGEYAWTLGTPAGPGFGNWRGALVRLLPIAEPTTTTGDLR